MDDVRLVVLVIHISSGVVAVLLAVVVMCAGAGQDWSSRWGAAYVAAVMAVAVSALVLALAGSTLPSPVRGVLIGIAIATAVVAIVGYRMARRRRTRPEISRPWQLRLMWGSLTSLVSAIAVVSTPVVVWVPVVVVGSVLTEWGYTRARRNPSWA